jgi:hypothetical protein
MSRALVETTERDGSIRVLAIKGLSSKMAV